MTWSNWSGGVSFDPVRVVRPESESALEALVTTCRSEGWTVRPVGEGHSWTPLVETDHVLVSLEELTGLIDHGDGEVTVRAGTTLGDLGLALHDEGLALANLGDVSMQTIAGAVATGTHGTGPTLQSLSGALVGGRLVTGTGEIRPFHRESDPTVHRAAQVSLGALGVFTTIDLAVQPTYKLQRREYCTNFSAVADRLPTLIAENRNFDCYWYPRSDEVKLRLLNPPGGGTDRDALEEATLVTEETDWWHEVIPAHDEIGRRFEEMEYAVPRSQGLSCLRAVRDRVRGRWRGEVGWRVLVRTVAPDEAYLSTEYDRPVMTISLIQNAELPHDPYFQDLEPLLRTVGGRPHWGKRHSLRADELADLYPRWDRFQDVRARFDPDGVFTTPYLRSLLGPIDD